MFNIILIYILIRLLKKYNVFGGTEKGCKASGLLTAHIKKEHLLTQI